MKKKFYFLTIITLCLLFVTGCNKSSSTQYIWSVSTGDTVSIKLNCETGYDMSYDLPFEITKDDKTYITGKFISIDGYNDFVSSHTEDEIVDEEENDDIKYIIYSVGTNDEPVYKVVVYLKDSSTGLLLTNKISEESTKEVLNLLTINLY